MNDGIHGYWRLQHQANVGYVAAQPHRHEIISASFKLCIKNASGKVSVPSLTPTRFWCTFLFRKKSIIHFCKDKDLQLPCGKIKKCLFFHLPEHFVGVAWDGSLLFRSSVALWLEQRVRPAVHHHSGGGHGNDGHAIAHAGLQAVVPLVVRNRQQTWETRWRRGGESGSECRQNNYVRDRCILYIELFSPLKLKHKAFVL